MQLESRCDESEAQERTASSSNQLPPLHCSESRGLLQHGLAPSFSLCLFVALSHLPLRMAGYSKPPSVLSRHCLIAARLLLINQSLTR